MNATVLWKVFLDAVLPLFGTAALSCLVWLAKEGAQWLATKKGATKKGALFAELGRFTSVVVADMESTVRPFMGRKLTAAEVVSLRAQALTRLKEILSERMKGEIVTVLHIAAPQVDSYLAGELDKAAIDLPTGDVIASKVAALSAGAAQIIAGTTSPALVPVAARP